MKTDNSIYHFIEPTKPRVLGLKRLVQRCPQCQKELRATSESQMAYNLKEHLDMHKRKKMKKVIGEEVTDIEILEGKIESEQDNNQKSINNA